MINRIKYFVFKWISVFIVLNISIIQCHASDTGRPVDGLIPDSIISLGSGDKTEYAFVVEKNSQQISLYKYDGKYEKLNTLACSTGEKAGKKTRSGDKKTPEGVYFFTKQFKKRYLAPVYGEMAFPMDFPNLIDKEIGINGSSIWMHGTNKKIKPRESNGCIVLANTDIKRVSKYVFLNHTPIIVAEKLNYTPLEDRERIKDSLQAFLEKWRLALAKGSYQDYLRFYDSGYLPDISWWPAWMKIRSLDNEKKNEIELKIDAPLFFKSDGVYVALFHLRALGGGQEVAAGLRKLFIQKKDDDYLIVGDQFQPALKHSWTASPNNPFIMACRGIKTFLEGDHEIADLVDKWLKAWSSKDIKTYGSFYAVDFRSDGMNLDRWLKKKRRLNRKYKYIHVSKDKLVIKTGDKRTSASFTQIYQSNNYKAVGRKKLILKQENGKWKIYRETWKKI